MNIVLVENYDALSRKASQYIEEQLNGKPDSVLGLATGSTPLGTYRKMIQSFQDGEVDFKDAFTLNLDEYVGLNRSHPQSYHFFMRKQLFELININKDRTFIPNGNADNLQEECRQYEELIGQIGPPDLQLLGIGENGHIGFNEPGSSFKGETHIIELAQSTREANARFFSSIEEVPKQAITMGIKSILKSKKIILLASGERKAAAIKQLLETSVDEQFPASVLNNHDHVTLIVDKEAYKQIKA